MVNGEIEVQNFSLVGGADGAEKLASRASALQLRLFSRVGTARRTS